MFLDNMLIYSTKVEEHFELLEKVFTCLHKYKFYCKLKKCSFLQWTTTFLGFDIMPEGLKISNTKGTKYQGMAKANYRTTGTIFFRFCAVFSKIYKGI